MSLIDFSTTDASADLLLDLGCVSGSGGTGWIAGYVVETVGGDSTAGTLIYGK